MHLRTTATPGPSRPPRRTRGPDWPTPTSRWTRAAPHRAVVVVSRCDGGRSGGARWSRNDRPACRNRHDQCRRKEEPSHAGTLRQTGFAMQSIELTIDARGSASSTSRTSSSASAPSSATDWSTSSCPMPPPGSRSMETGSGSDSDLLNALNRILPRDDRYRHAHGSPGHGADHLLPALVSPSVTLPVLCGSGGARDLAVGGARWT